MDSPKKKYLGRYRTLVKNIKRLEDKVEELNIKIECVPSSRITGMPKGGTIKTVEDLIADRDELERRIVKLKARGRLCRREITDAIDELDDERFAEILEYYYLDCLTLEDIAEVTAYSTRYIYELYKKAIAEISIPTTETKPLDTTNAI